MSSRPAAAVLVVVAVLAALLSPVASAAPTAARAATVRACSALRAQPGITASTIRLGNVADVTGPVPGLTQDVQRAAQAFVAYAAHAGTRICGRRLALTSYDSRTTTDGDQQAATDACAQTFATVGSHSVSDDGGASVAERCGLPDLRVTTSTFQRRSCDTCFAVHASDAGHFPASVPDRLARDLPDDVARTGFVHLDTEADRATGEAAVWAARGVTVVTSIEVTAADFNYAPIVARLQQSGVRVVRFLGPASSAARLTQAMQQLNFSPAALVVDPAVYADPSFAAESTAPRTHPLVALDHLPVDGTSTNANLRLYRTWLDKTSPGATPTTDGLFAWSAMRLFVREATALRGSLTRAALVTRLHAVGSWTARGLHGAQMVGPRRTSGCWRFLQLTSTGRWTAYGSARFGCGPVLAP